MKTRALKREINNSKKEVHHKRKKNPKQQYSQTPHILGDEFYTVVEQKKENAYDYCSVSI